MVVDGSPILEKGNGKRGREECVGKAEGRQKCETMTNSPTKKPPRPDRGQTMKHSIIQQGKRSTWFSGAAERPIYLNEERAFGDWLEMAVQKGRQNPQQLLPSISDIVDDMNNTRTGKTFQCRAASDFACAMDRVRAAEVWLHVEGVVPLKAVCRAFMEGREATTFQKLVVRGNQPMSMEQVASLSHASLGRLLADYLARISELLPNAREPSVNQEHAQSAIVHLTKEATVLRLAHVIGRPSNMYSYAEQKSASVPTEELQRVIEVGAFTDLQARQMWDCWYLVCAAMIHLKAQENMLQAKAQSAANQAAAFPDRIANYGNLLTTAADLKRNLEQQANLVFKFNCEVTMTILTPWQTIMCQEAMNPTPFRPHLLFLSGLFPERHPAALKASN